MSMTGPDPKQAVRLRVFWMAAGSYLVGYIVLTVSYFLGVIDAQVLKYLVVPFLLPNIAFYALFRTGLNLKFKEPSLTAAQIIVATMVIMYTVYLAGQVRPLVLMFYLILFLFGLLRLTTRQLLAIGCFALVTYFGVIFLVVQLKGEHVSLRMEVLYGLVLGLGLIWFALVGGYISKIRDKLRQSLKTIQQMAIHDELTGVFNRHHLNHLLETEKSRCTRSGEDFSICILDVDHFKRVNDGLGHLAGDKVLKHFAAEVKKSMRTIDSFGRFGGEEFLLVLPRTNIEQARLCAERIRRMTEQLAFPGLDRNFSITSSFGIAQYRPGEDLQETLSRADTALYKAKNTGRNRVESAELELVA
jgi:diguanylate cyclase (GGDEF)-like protein